MDFMTVCKEVNYFEPLPVQIIIGLKPSIITSTDALRCTYQYLPVLCYALLQLIQKTVSFLFYFLHFSEFFMWKTNTMICYAMKWTLRLSKESSFATITIFGLARNEVEPDITRYWMSEQLSKSLETMGDLTKCPSFHCGAQCWPMTWYKTQKNTWLDESKIVLLLVLVSNGQNPQYY